VNLKCHGTPSLHLAITLAALPGGGAFGAAAASLILTNSCDLTAKDDQGYTALHCAAQLNLLGLVESILGAAGEHLEILLEAKDRVGQRPLHRCAEKNAVTSARVLLAAGANVGAATGMGATPLHVCAAHGSAAVWALLRESGAACRGHADIYGRDAVECAIRHGWAVDDATETLLHRIQSIGGDGSAAAPKAATALLTHPLCMEHFSCPPAELESSPPPENVRRLTVLLDGKDGALRCSHLNEGSEEGARSLLWVEEARAAAMADVLRVHEWSHVRKLQYVCDGCQADGDAEDEGRGQGGGMAHLDGDTSVSQLSFRAALRGAGSVCQAVDMVMSGEVRNAFCAVRPPGHHAGPRGLCQNDYGENEPDSHGFCLLNNLSIGAAYAMNLYRHSVRRVAMVDFDVHHGNGTEETVRWLRPGIDSAPILNPFSFGSVHTPRFKPWFDQNDADNVLFVSVHGFGPRERGLEAYPQACFYPGTGRTLVPDMEQMATGQGKAAAGAAAEPPSAAAAGVDQSSAGAGAGAGGAAQQQRPVLDEEEEDEDEDSDLDPDLMEVDEAFDGFEEEVRCLPCF
jgi:acetoin utilization deacetylase AcuC-like enzyme